MSDEQFLERARNLLTRWPAPEGTGAIYRRVRAACQYAAEGENLDEHAARITFVVEKSQGNRHSREETAAARDGRNGNA